MGSIEELTQQLTGALSKSRVGNSPEAIDNVGELEGAFEVY